MHRFRSHRSVLVLLILLVGSMLALATRPVNASQPYTTFLNTLPGNDSASLITAPSVRHAVLFNTSPTADGFWRINALTLRLRGLTQPSRVTAHIYTNGSPTNFPSSPLATIGSVTVPAASAAADYSFPVSRDFSLSPNRSYWLLVTADEAVEWLASDPPVTASGIFSLEETRTNSGSGWVPAAATPSFSMAGLDGFTITGITRLDPTPTRAETVRFEVTTDKPVFGWTPANWGLRAYPGAFISDVVTAPDGLSSVVTVNTGTGEGNIAIQNGSSNGLDRIARSSVTSFPYVIDRTPPTISSFRLVDFNPTTSTRVRFQIVFSETVAGDTAADYEAVTDIPGTTIDPVGLGGPANSRIVNVIIGEGAGTVGLRVLGQNIRDAAGNPLAGVPSELGEAYTVDTASPFVQRITRNDPSPTAADVVAWTVTFTEPVKGVTLFSFDPVIEGTLLPPAGQPYLTGITPVSDAVYVVTGQTATGSGTFGLDLIDGGQITDLLGNPLGGPSGGNGDFSGERYIIDRDTPQVTVNQASDQADPTAASSIAFDVQFSEQVSGFTADDVVITGSAGATTAVVNNSGDDQNFRVLVSGMTTNGTVVLDIPAGVAADAAGNLNAAATSTDNEVTYQGVPTHTPEPPPPTNTPEPPPTNTPEPPPPTNTPEPLPPTHTPEPPPPTNTPEPPPPTNTPEPPPPTNTPEPPPPTNTPEPPPPTNTPEPPPPTNTPEPPPPAEGRVCLQFNHPDAVSYNSSERPQLTVQFGNCGPGRVTNVRLECRVSSGPATFTDVHVHGAFGSVNRSERGLSFSGRPELPPGQNYNVSFNINPGQGESHIGCDLHADHTGGAGDGIRVTTR